MTYKCECLATGDLSTVFVPFVDVATHACTYEAKCLFERVPMCSDLPSVCCPSGFTTGIITTEGVASCGCTDMVGNEVFVLDNECCRADMLGY